MTTLQIIKAGAEAAAPTVIIGTWMQLIPPIAAFFAMCYYVAVLAEKVTGKTLDKIIADLRKSHEDHS